MLVIAIMNAPSAGVPAVDSAPRPLVLVALGLLRRVLFHALLLLVAVALFAGYEHYHLQGRQPLSLGCLVAAALLALTPVRAVLSEIGSLERHVLHWMHGLGGLALVGAAASGVVSGEPVLSRAALAPFAIMGAAQALMHSNQPRNARQAAAMGNFVRSLPEVEQFTRSRDLTSPQSIARAMGVLSDLIGKAQVLGETELQADPGFQGALRQVAAKTGATLGLDSAQALLDQLAKNPAAASGVVPLRQRLARARRVIAQDDHAGKLTVP